MNIIYCFIYLISVSVIIFFIGRVFPRRWIFENKFPFRALPIEKEGAVYEKLKIKRWKTKLPDASVILCKIIPFLIPKKRLDNFERDKLPVLIKESCVAEATHFFAIAAGFYCVKILPGIGGWLFAIIFSVINIPFIIIQRYNRPRLIRAADFKNRYSA